MLVFGVLGKGLLFLFCAVCRDNGIRLVTIAWNKSRKIRKPLPLHCKIRAIWAGL